MDQNTGKLIITFGLVIVLGGLAIYFFYDKLSWLGRLPGDIRIEKENSRFYFPITTMIVLSVAVNVLIRVYRYLMG